SRGRAGVGTRRKRCSPSSSATCCTLSPRAWRDSGLIAARAPEEPMMKRLYLAGLLLLLLTSAAGAGQRATDPAANAEAARSAMEEVRILRAVNRVGFTLAQGQAVLRILEAGEKEQTAAEEAGARQVDIAMTALQQAL